MSRRFQFSVRAMLVATALTAITIASGRALSDGSLDTPWLFIAYCAAWACLAAFWAMLNGTAREGVWCGIIFFVLAMVTMPLIGVAFYALGRML